MTQRDQGHAPGKFRKCPRCSMEPRHIIDARRRPMGGHLMQCKCGATDKFDSMAQALKGWRVMVGLVKPIAKTSNVRQLHREARA